MKANQKYFPLLDRDRRADASLPASSATSRRPIPSRVDRRQRAGRPAAPGRRQVLLRPGPASSTLASRVAGLDRVVYHGKLGSQGERVRRVQAIAGALAAASGASAELAGQADRAALLAKADLLTDMVGEFPELQGIMGGYYALQRRRGRRGRRWRSRTSTGRASPATSCRATRRRAGRRRRQARDAGRPVGHRPEAHRRQGSVRAAPPCARRAAHPDRAAAGAVARPGRCGADRARLAAVRDGPTPAGRQRAADPCSLLAFFSERLAASLADRGYSAAEVDAVLADDKFWQLGEVEPRLARGARSSPPCPKPQRWRRRTSASATS